MSIPPQTITPETVTDTRVISAVTHWLETMVVGLNLCPFARVPLATEGVRFAVTQAEAEEGLLRELAAEVQRLDCTPELQTTLLIHPRALLDFYHYNQFLTLAETLIRDLGYEGVFQVASFHPDYQFAGTEVDDAENYSNRSPYPLLHLLREDALEKAIANHPEPDQIPQRNIQRLTGLGRAKLEAMLLACKGPARD